MYIETQLICTAFNIGHSSNGSNFFVRICIMMVKFLRCVVLIQNVFKHANLKSLFFVQLKRSGSFALRIAD